MNSLPQVRPETIKAVRDNRNSSGSDYFNTFWECLKRENVALAHEMMEAFTVYDDEGRTQIEQATLYTTLHVLHCLDLQWQSSSKPRPGQLPRLLSATIREVRQHQKSHQYMKGLTDHFRTFNPHILKEIHKTGKWLGQNTNLGRQDVVTMTILHILICVSSEMEPDPASVERKL